VRRLLSPRWLLGHALALTAAAVCVRLGWWQWQRAHAAGGSLQNLGYAVQWPVFACFILALWWRVLRDELRPPPPAEPPRAAPAYRAPHAPANPRPPVAADDPADAELAAYNRYLGWLHEQDQTQKQNQRGPR
jgi:DNA-binding transcriptional regulator of glucitol operon